MRIFTLFFALTMFIFSHKTGYSQTCNPPPIPSDECVGTPIFSCNLDGYSGSTAGFTPSISPAGFCGLVENDQYLKFTVTELPVIFDIAVSNCSNAKGIQAAIYETNDCTNFTLVSNCRTITLLENLIGTAAMTIGDTYYLLIDGFEGDICDYSISVISGISSDIEVSASNQSICFNGETELDASSSTVTASTTITWIASNGGNIVSDGNTLTPIIDEPGDYTLKLLDTISCCASEKLIEVSLFSTKPISSINGQSQITCTNDVLTLNGANSSGEIDYLWSTSDGNITSDPNLSSVTLDDVGTYILVVGDVNGCTDEDSINITIDTISPDVNTAFETQNLLTCDVVNLNITGSSSDNVDYGWTGPSSFSSNNQTTNINIAGTYILTTTSIDNGCTASTSLLVPQDTISPISDAGLDSEINCTNTLIEIGTNNSSSGANFSYQWLDSNTNLLDNSIKTQVSIPDTYQLIVTNSFNGCTGQSNTLVGIDTLSPNLILTPAQILNCNHPDTDLTMTEGNGVATLSYSWTDSGSLNETTATINVATAGIYHAVLTNTANGCTTSEDVEVLDTQNNLVADAGQDHTLTCFQPSFLLGDTNTTSSGPNIQYEWKNTSNVVLGTASTYNTSIPDTYTLIVKDNSTGCTTTNETVISEDKTKPIANITFSEDTITCVRSSIDLVGSTADNINYFYQWTDENMINISNVLNISVSSGGQYDFEVTRQDNGCKDTASVVIHSNNTPPSISLEQPKLITCDNNIVIIPANSVSNSSSITYAWTTTDGNFFSPQNLLSPFVDAAGTYSILVTDPLSGCTASATIDAYEDITPPIADVVDDFELNCQTENLVLGDVNTSIGTDFEYEWKNISGTVVSNNITLDINLPNTYSLIVTDTTNGCTATDITVISENKTYPSTIVGYTEDTITCNRSSIDITGGANNSGPSIMYTWYDATWNPISTVTSVAVTSGGQYHFVANRQDNFCKDTSSFEIFENNSDPVISNTLPDVITCTNPFISLPVTVASQNSPLTYAWSTTDGHITSTNDILNIFVDESGSYDLLVSDLTNGCTSTHNIVAVSDTILPIVDAGVDFELNCEFETLNLGSINTSSGLNFQYEWKDILNNVIGATKNKIINQPNTYDLLVTNTDNGCSATDQIVVSENKVDPVADISNTATIITCDLPEIVLNGSGSTPNGNLDFDWKLDNQSISIDDAIIASQKGTYRLIVKDKNNKCEHEVSVLLTENKIVPTISTDLVEEINCVRSDANLDLSIQPASGNLVYTWSTSTGNFTGPTDQLDTKVNMPDDYLLTILNQDNGCTTDKTVVVIENKVEPTMTLNVNDELNCINSTVEINSLADNLESPMTYSWNGPTSKGSTTNSNLIADQKGDYFLTTTDQSNGCTSTTTITVIENAKKPNSASLIIEAPTCFEDKNGSIYVDLVLGGNLPLTYNLNEKPFTERNEFKNLIAGKYTISIKDSIGCTWDTIVELNQPRPVSVKILGEPSIILGEQLRLFAQTNQEQLDIEWFQNDSLIARSYEINIEPVRSSLFRVSAYDENGCTASDEMQLKVINDKSVYFPTGITPNGDGKNDIFYCFSKKSVKEVLSLNIFDRWGEQVFGLTNFQTNDASNGWDGKLKNKEMSSGIYIYACEVLFKDGKKEVFSGDFTVFK